jgi:hypothetical protein
LLLSLSSTALAAEPVDPATRAAARKIATDGVTALQQGNADLASEKLEKAFELLPAPSIALWSARALVKRGKLVEASERYLQAGRLPPAEGNEQAVQAQAQKDAAKELAELTPRIPKLVVALDGAQPSEVTLSLDGKALPAALVGEEQLANPGAHQLNGTRGAEQATESFSLVESQKSHVVLHFHGPAPVAAPPPSAPAAPAPTSVSEPPARSASSGSSGRKTLGIVALAVGGAGIVTGAVTGIIAIGKHSDLNDNPDCYDGKCLRTVQSDVDSFRAMRTISSVGFIAGGVLAATGVVLLVASGSSSQHGSRSAPAPTVALRLSPSYVSLTGGF